MSPVHFTPLTSLMRLSKSCHKDFMPRRNTIVGSHTVSIEFNRNCEVWSGQGMAAVVFDHKMADKPGLFCSSFSFSSSLSVACLLPVKRECCKASARAVKWKGSS